MARRMRAMDWSATTLGPVDRWPPSLRTSVSTCLGCAFPIVLWWGPELAVLYNDEVPASCWVRRSTPRHSASEASKSGRRSGTSSGRCWRRSSNAAKPPGRATCCFSIDRGYLEETISPSPARFTDDGRVSGIFCPVIETTEKVVGERRLRTLRESGGQVQRRAGRELRLRSGGLHSRLQSTRHSLRADLSSRRLTRDSRPHGHRRHRAAHLVLFRPSLAGSRYSGSVAAAAGGARGRGSRDRPAAANIRITAQGAVEGAAATGARAAGDATRPGLTGGRARRRDQSRPALDDDYRTFFGLIATQIASALAKAQALQEERQRAEALAELDRAKTTFFSNV